MLVQTLSTSFRKARSTNSTDSSFPSRIPTITKPSGQGVIELCSPGEGSLAQNGMLAVFYGTGGNNDTFSSRVIGWRIVGENNPRTALWVPVVLVEFALTLSAVVGVAGATIVATERFADTITLTTGNDDISVDIVSPTGDVIAHAVLDLKGFELAEVTFQITSGTTDMNALVSLL